MYKYFKKINVSMILSLLLIFMFPLTNAYGENTIVKVSEEISSAKLKLSIDNLLNTNYLSTARDISFNYSVSNLATYSDPEPRTVNSSGSKLILTSSEITLKDKIFSEKLIVENNKIQDGVTTNYRLYKDASNNIKAKFLGKESSWIEVKPNYNNKIYPSYMDYEGYYDNSNVDVIKDIKLHFDMTKHGTMTGYVDNQNNTHVIGEVDTNGLKYGDFKYDPLSASQSYLLFSGCKIKYECIINKYGKLIEYISNRQMGNYSDSTPVEKGNYTVKVLFNYDKVDLSNTSNLDSLFDTSSFSKWKEIIGTKGFQGLEATITTPSTIH